MFDSKLSQDQKTYTVKAEKDLDSDNLVIVIPQEALDRLGWKEGDTLSIDETEISWDHFEGHGLVVSKPNDTK